MYKEIDVLISINPRKTIKYQINEKVNQSLDSSGESDWNFGWDNITSKPIEEWTNKDFVLYFLKFACLILSLHKSPSDRRKLK